MSIFQKTLECPLNNTHVIGQKTCMHVHGVFPYLYVAYDGTQPLERYTRQFACSANKALNVALGRASSNQQHVFRITLVSGM